MTCSVDASAIIQAWRRYYPPDAFPGFWHKLDGLIRDGEVRAAEEVRVELERKDDEVLEWAVARENFFVALDEDVQVSVREILRDHPRLVDTRRGRSGADPFVIALARVNEYAVLTEERSSGVLSKPKIPDVCHVYGIRSLSLLELIREKRWVFRG